MTPPSKRAITVHQRAVHHDRLIRVVGRKRTRFEIGVRRGRPPLAVYASGDVLVS